MERKWLHSRSLQHGNSAFAVFLYAACISILFLLLAPKEYNFIAGDYYLQLNNIIHGHALRAADGKILDRYPPVIPYLFSIFFTLSEIFHSTPQLFYIIYSVIAISVTTVFVYKTATLFLSQSVSIIASILFASCPFIQFGIVRVASEPTYIMLLYAAIYLLIRAYIKRHHRFSIFMAIGILSGLAMLTRPAGIFFPFLFFLFILIAFSLPLAKRQLFACVLLLSSLLIITPWEFAISRQEGYLVPLSTGGPISIWDGLRFNNCTHRSPLNLSPQAQRLSDTIATHLNDFNSNTTPFLKQQFRQAPMTFVRLIGLKSLRAWYGVESQNKRQELFNLILISIYLILAILGTFSYFKNADRQKVYIAIFFLVIILYSWAMTTIVLSILRYMSPVLGLILIFSAQGLHTLYKRYDSKLQSPPHKV
ncbi:MAG: glycosyltransferase family 39 protein [Bacteroidetes bacterium]|nr:glycosyltransferase family 39 protein [Bacteroidota bacterium]